MAPCFSALIANYPYFKVYLPKILAKYHFKRIFKETQDELPIQNNTRDASRFVNTTIDRVPQVSEQYISPQ